MNQFIISASVVALLTGLIGCQPSEEVETKSKKLLVEVVFDGACPVATEVKKSRCISDMGLEVVCAHPEDTIEWEPADVDFSIAYPGVDPCKEKKKKECKVKDKDKFAANAGEFVKYDVVAADSSYDPYIIIMR